MKGYKKYTSHHQSTTSKCHTQILKEKQHDSLFQGSVELKERAGIVALNACAADGRWQEALEVRRGGRLGSSLIGRV